MGFVMSPFDPPAAAPSAPGKPAPSPAKRHVKILIADDDGLSRAILRSMLKQQSNALVLETDNGGHALEIIDSAAVDAVFLDVRMPVMDGLEVLESLRGDPTHRHLPVVMLSAHSDPATVQRAIRLGISDYLVKPIQPLLMDARIQRVLSAVDKGPWDGQRHPGVRPTRLAAGGRRVLLVDPDTNFGSFVVGLFEDEFEIVHVDNGRDAARALASWTPEIACLASGLRLPTETALARKIRKVSPTTALYFLCNEPGPLVGEAAALFAGAIAKTFIPGIFRRDFAKVLNETSEPARPLPAKGGGLLDDAMREAIVTAARQTIGVTMAQEVSLLDAEATAELAGECWATVELRADASQPAVTVALAAPRDHVERLAERMVGTPVALAEGAGDAFGELVNTVAGRIVSVLEARGVPLKVGLPAVSPEPGPDTTPDRFTFLLPLETAGGERFLVGARLIAAESSAAA